MLWLAQQTPKFEIQAVVAEKKDDLTAPTGGLSSLTGGLLGLSQQPSGVSTLQEAVYSADLADRLVVVHRLDREIFKDRWDPQLKRWKPATGLVATFVSLVRDLFGVPVQHDISSTDVQRYLREIVFVKSDINTSNSAILFYYPDRNEGRRLLEIILTDADNQVRQQQRAQIGARLNYLYARLRQARLAEQVGVLASLIQRLETQNAVINADQTLTVDILSAPRASLQISRPRYPLVFGLIIITAGLLTLAIVWTVAVVRRR